MQLRVYIAITAIGVGPAAAQAPVVWTLSGRPLVQIGTAAGDPNYEFANAISSVRLTDGRIVVLDAQSAQLRFFDAKGGFCTVLAAAATAPGSIAHRRVCTTRSATLSWFTIKPTIVNHIWMPGASSCSQPMARP